MTLPFCVYLFVKFLLFVSAVGAHFVRTHVKCAVTRVLFSKDWFPSCNMKVVRWCEKRIRNFCLVWVRVFFPFNIHTFWFCADLIVSVNILSFRLCWSTRGVFFCVLLYILLQLVYFPIFFSFMCANSTYHLHMHNITIFSRKTLSSFFAKT